MDDLDITAKTVVYDQPIGLVSTSQLLDEQSTITETSFLKSSEGIKRIQDHKLSHPLLQSQVIFLSLHG